MPMIANYLIKSGSKLADALRLIGENASGICFVVSNDKLIGTLSDGDIRRALLKGILLSDTVDAAMSTNYFSLSTTATFQEIQRSLELYKFIPIVDKDNRLVDLATPKKYHHIPLVQPIFNGNELEYLTDCILNGWVSSQGAYVGRFEQEFSAYVGSSQALAVSNGTVALHLALVTLGIGAGDEVILPDLTFASPANTVLYVGAKPVLVDVDRETMVMTTKSVINAISDKTRAIILVHLYGQPVNMTEILSICRDKNIYVIEDCAEALGTLYKGKHVGLFGDAATFSFFGNKTITTGEGGMLLFRDESLLKHAAVLRDHGMSKSRRYWHDFVGFNYRLTNLQAAVGVAQLERLPLFVAKKRWIAEEYRKHLKLSRDIFLPGDVGEGVVNSHWLYTISLSEKFANYRDLIINDLKVEGIEVRPTFYALHKMPIYGVEHARHVGGYSNSTYLEKCGISLPSSVGMTPEDIDYICQTLLSLLSKYENGV